MQFLRRNNVLYTPPEKQVLQPQVLKVSPLTVTDFGKNWLAERLDLEHLKWVCGKLRMRYDPSLALPPIAGGSGGASNWAQTTTLAHWTGQDNASWGNLSPGFGALCSVLPDSSKTGSTITEISYTTYARLSIANTLWAAPVSGGAGGQSTISNNGTLTWAACTAGSATILGFAYCTAVTAGNVIAWGSVSSTVISTTQTPPVIQTGGLQLGLT